MKALSMVVLMVNVMRVHISMVAKELCLQILEEDSECPLPVLDPSVYKTLYTSIYKGR